MAIDGRGGKDYERTGMEIRASRLSKITNLLRSYIRSIVQMNSFLDQTETAKKAMHIHPIFGPLSYEEWARMRFKHSIHHLLQFGLIAIA